MITEPRPFGASIPHYDRIRACVTARSEGKPAPHRPLEVLTSMYVLADVVGIRPNEVWQFVEDSIGASA